MYGTIARMKVKPGMEQALEKLSTEFEDREVPGSIGFYIYRMDNDPNELYMAVIFESRETYQANANSPEQNLDYQKLVEVLEGPPEWHDGEIIYSQNSAMAQAAK